MLKLSGKPGGGKYTPEEIADVELEEVKKMILQQDPKAFDKKAAAKKGASKKAAPKKAAAKKTSTKKAAPKKS
jgi:DNA topoisomerase-1